MPPPLEGSSGDLVSLLDLLLQVSVRVIALKYPCCCSASPSRAAGNEIIGIDLGTTNSCVAVMEGKVTAQGRLLCPQLAASRIFCSCESCKVGLFQNAS